ncbi:hypothetical protein [Ulvibacter antarcticus]|uniref:Lipocalin-like protein n=1 Tax=Ulvibacter antarcticus TaxID=442714 RepID=A0A3L9Y8Z9_9FLAO|nr:hypothetical protein [Ulvibacter antarcticus]RMA57173.1 hypothetical protein BXY75_3060 [Ulvibacter antarcticus]
MKNLKIFLLAFITILATSCSKNDDTSEAVIQPTNLELLTSGKWYLKSASNSLFTECQQRTYMHFVDTSNLIIEEFDDSGEFCLSSGSQNYNYTFSDPLIDISLGQFHLTYTIETISNTQLILEREVNGSIEISVYGK